MMKAIKLMLATLTLALSPVAVMNSARAADEHSFTIGYAQTHINADTDGAHFGNTGRGINLKYRYEITDDWGFITSFTHTQHTQGWGNGKDGKLEYNSFAVGPTYRIDDQFSVYTLVGDAIEKKKITVNDNAYSLHHHNVVMAAGLQFNPRANWVIDAGYEYSKIRNDEFGTWMLGAGYRF